MPGRHLCLLVLALLPSFQLSADSLDDVTVRVSRMQIDHAQVGEAEVDVDFIRTVVELQAGFGPIAMGLQFQDARSGDPSGLPETQKGWMWRLSHQQLLHPKWQLISDLRLGLSPDDDPSQPLYATDTDFAMRLVRSSPEGFFYLWDRPVHPSAYVGGIVSRYGRVQAVGGAGLWWRGLSGYVTGFHSFNGVADPMNPGDDGDIVFAHLKNQGITLSAGYEWNGLLLDVNKNFGFENSGDDLTFGVGYRYLLGSGEWLP